MGEELRIEEPTLQLKVLILCQDTGVANQQTHGR